MEPYRREQERQEKNSTVTGIVLTVAVHLCIIAVGFACGLKYIYPPPEEESILLDFSEDVPAPVIREMSGQEPRAVEPSPDKEVELVQRSEGQVTGTQANEAAEATVKEIEAYGVKVKAYASNAADFAQTEDVVKQVKEEFGAIDILVNNAGITKDGLMLRMTEAQWDAVIAVNLKSAFNFIHACVPVMMRQRGGSIINMASVVGVHGNAGQCNYAASKAGLIALAKSIAQEMGAKGIRANAIAPGFIETAMTAALPDDVRAEWCKKIPLRRGGTPDDVANVALFLASDLSSYVSGQVIQIDGGMNM